MFILPYIRVKCADAFLTILPTSWKGFDAPAILHQDFERHERMDTFFEAVNYMLNVFATIVKIEKSV